MIYGSWSRAVRRRPTAADCKPALRLFASCRRRRTAYNGPRANSVMPPSREAAARATLKSRRYHDRMALGVSDAVRPRLRAGKIYLRRLRGSRFARAAEDNAAVRRSLLCGVPLLFASARIAVCAACGPTTKKACRRVVENGETAIVVLAT